jgi:hypothetical protein
MTPEAQRIAIAEACGWVNIRPSNTWWYGLRPGNNGLGDRPGEAIPDYLSDLNAMHEAEKVLTAVQLGLYLSKLADLFPYSGGNSWTFGYARAIHANAAQRAEAFLRTLGLWREI